MLLITGSVWAAQKTESAAANSRAEPQRQLFTHAEKDYWAFQLPANPQLPVVQATAWPKSPIDRFILAKLEEKGLKPAPSADKRVLIRRVTFDLIGLPSTPDEIDAILADQSPRAFEKLVERLLESPHYGERWGRHWLDVVRYADTTANDGNFVMRYAYRYRNYVIDAFNSDMPYDQFVVEQLAGDLLPTTDDVSLTTRRVIATGFLMLGPKALAEADKEQVRMDMVDEQIDVTSRAFLGLTVACARCHDHKFDPIPTTDYYSLAGIFRSIEMLGGNAGVTAMWQERPIEQRTAQQRRRLAELQKRTAELVKLIAQRKSQPVAAQAAWEKQVLADMTEAPSATLPASASGNLVAWLDAGDINNDGGASNPKTNEPVRVWKDKSGKGNDVSSLPTPNDPSYATEVIGSNAVVRFAGDTFQTLQKDKPAGFPGGNSSRSMFVVAIPRNPQHNGEFLDSISHVVGWGDMRKKNCWNLFQFVHGKTWFAYHSNDFNSGAHTFARDVPAIFEHRHVKDTGNGVSKATFWVDGKLDGAFTPNPVITTDNTKPLVIGSYHYLGGQAHERAIGDVAEVIIYNRDLTSAEQNQVGRYLTRKYGLKSSYTRPLEIVTIPPGKRTKQQQETLRHYYLEHHDATYKTLQAELRDLTRSKVRLEKENPPIMVMAPKEAGGRNIRMHLRGNRFTLGDEVPRRFLQIIAGENQPPIETQQSGRLELARWIASAENPLTARVMVNRIWQGHFGTGLVATSDNFGTLGEQPSHPELLDWLATQFVKSGWSVKAMHRQILLSSTYQQSCIADSSPLSPRSIDPDNRWLGHFPRRRLEAEAIRDALLAIGGQLDRRIGGGGESIARLFDKGDAVDKKLGLVSAANFNFDYEGYNTRRRSIYLPVVRNQLPEILSVFDAADANAVTAKRNETTVPSQAMFMLNSAFVREQSLQFAKQLLADKKANDEARLRRAYVQVLGRLPTADEMAAAVTYMRLYTAKAKSAGRTPDESRLAAWQSYCQMLFCLNEFIYVE
jgi:hypothetical protein